MMKNGKFYPIVMHWNHLNMIWLQKSKAMIIYTYP